MHITVKYFASLRERQGRNEEQLSLENSLTVAEVWENVSGLPATDNVLMAINMEYVKPDTQVRDGDEIAFFPPVTGG